MNTDANTSQNQLSLEDRLSLLEEMIKSDYKSRGSVEWITPDTLVRIFSEFREILQAAGKNPAAPAADPQSNDVTSRVNVLKNFAQGNISQQESLPVSVNVPKDYGKLAQKYEDSLNK